MYVTGVEHHSYQLHSATNIRNDVLQCPEERAIVKTIRAEDSALLDRVHKAFERWQKLTSQEPCLQY